MAEPRVALAPGALLRACANAEASTLLLASGEAVQLNALAAAILMLCDGTRSPNEIASEIARGSSPQNVLEFISAASSLHWIIARAAR